MKLSIVTSVFYSENYLHEFYSRCAVTAQQLIDSHDISFTSYEIVFVNDGSPDKVRDVLISLSAAHQEIIVVDLSRNYGHHYALKAGLEYSTGDYVFLIDCDLEESPELLLDFWNKMSNDRDIDVVFGVQQKRKGNFFEVYAGKFFYRFLNKIIDIEYPHDTLTTRLMNRKYVDAILRYPEKALELWSVFTLAGFRQVAVTTKKLNKGSTTYHLGRKIKLAIETITSTSNRPLYFIFFVGLFIFCISGFYLSYILFISLTTKGVVRGWPSTIASIWLVGGITFLLLGIIAIYLAKIFQEVKSRPLYNIKNVIRGGKEIEI